MTRTSNARSRSAATPRNTWRERLFVLGGFALAALYTAASLAAGSGTEAIGPLWMAAIAWTVMASLTAALWQGFRHRDWSAFRACAAPDGRDERMDWAYGNGIFMGSWYEQNYDTTGYSTHFHSP